MKEFASYRAKRQKKINDKMAQWRKAKERKKLEAPPPEYPIEITENCYEITVKRYLNGSTIEKNYFLDGISNTGLSSNMNNFFV